MPLEIRELVIRTQVTTGPVHTTGSAGTTELSEEARQQLVRDCTQQVLRSLKRRKER